MSNITKKYVDYAGLQEYDSQIKGVISTDFVGATSSLDGAAGRVPAPESGDENKILRGDGTWAIPPSGSSIGTSSTAAVTSTKVVSISNSDWRLQEGTIINVIFDHTDTSGEPVYLNVNSTGAYPVFLTGARANGIEICEEGLITQFIFHNNVWYFMAKNKPAYFMGTRNEWDSLSATVKKYYRLVIIND